MEYHTSTDHDEEAGGGVQMVVTTVTVVILTVLSLLVLLMFTRRRGSSTYRLPPGPRGLPVFGSLLLLGKLPHRSLAKLSTQYGPLMFMRLGSKPTLVVSNPQMAQEILKTHDHVMASRPDQVISRYITFERKDMAYAPYGPHWRHVRKVCTLELFTSARLNQFQSIRRNEVLAMLQSILGESQQGNAVNMNEMLTNLTSNVITQMMWKKSYYVPKGQASSAEDTAFRDDVRETFALLGAVNIADFIPALGPMSMNLQGFGKRMKNVHERMDKFLGIVIDEHLKTKPSVSREDEDFVDALLNPSFKQDESEDSLPINTIKAVVLDMINAATDTSATTLEWALAELVKHPNMMRTAQNEIDSVVGTNRLVTEEDIPNLNYIQALVKETFRMHPPAPLSVPHESRHDCEVAGYHIPGGSLVIINLWAIHRDSSVWERPQQFDPERFLNSTVDLKGQDYELLPFGSGRRMCPAMNLGLGLVQYSLAQLLHCFSFTLPGDQKPQELDMSERFGLTCPMSASLTVMASQRLPAHVIYSTSPP